MPIEVKNGVVVLDDATPEEMERLRAAVRILIDYLLESAALRDQAETQTEAEAENWTAISGEVKKLKSLLLAFENRCMRGRNSLDP